MAIGPVVTRGYGTFGSISLVVRAGYQHGGRVVDAWTAPERRADWTANPRRADYDAKDRHIDWTGDRR